MNKIALIAIAGFGISAVSLGAAIALGVGHGDIPGFDDAACPATSAGDPDTTRRLAWDGGDKVSISAAARVHYTPGVGTVMIVRGPADLVAGLTLNNGRIDMACHPHWRNRMLDITLPGRQFRAFDIGGLTEVDLNNLSQADLDINVAGKSDITATGKVEHLKIQAAGKNDSHMKDLTVGKLSVTVMGNSDIETSPRDDADITIMGRADIKLYSEPKHISTTIMGSGNIQHLAKNS